MNKKKVTGIIAVAAIVVIILIAAGAKKQSPAPEELTGEDRTEEAANSGNGAVDTGIDRNRHPGRIKCFYHTGDFSRYLGLVRDFAC